MACPFKECLMYAMKCIVKDGQSIKDEQNHLLVVGCMSVVCTPHNCVIDLIAL